MKTLLIANTKSVFTKELSYELRAQKREVFLLDFETLEITHNDKCDTSHAKAFLKYKKIPKLHMFFRMYFISKIINKMDADIINIHYSRWVYLFILKTLKQQKLVISFYGSDFYRSSFFIKFLQKKLYKTAHAISFTNPQMKKAFVKYYKGFEQKLYVCRFGLKTLDYIDINRNKSKAEIQDTLGYDKNKTIITCGYNATQGQQHQKIIQEISTLPKEVLETIQFVFPLTYGDANYKQEIISILKKSTLNYKILEDFLYTDDNAYVKLASDIMINLLKTDSFSGSMQEFLYASNHVITGSWLPYEVFDKEGIIYHKIDTIQGLNSKLLEVLKLQKDLSTNKNIIYNLSGWKNTINAWTQMYENC